MKVSRASLTVLTAAALFATGCASTKTPDAGKTKAMSVQEISKQWKQGNDLVVKGESVRTEAQKMIDAAGMKMKEGDAMVSRGKTLMTESEQAFRDTSKKN